MSERNIAVVRRLTDEGFVGGNVDVVDEVVAEDCVDHDPFPDQDQGRIGQRQACGMVVSGLSDRSIDDEVLAVGDKVVENWTFAGTHTGDFMGVPATGKRVTVRGTEIWRVQDGMIVERWGTIDSGSVMQQLGLVPEGQS
jgi:steroid delta-isomerase-like uncharacterized protein